MNRHPRKVACYSDVRSIRDAGSSASRWMEEILAASDPSSARALRVSMGVQWVIVVFIVVTLAAATALLGSAWGAVAVVAVEVAGLLWKRWPNPYVPPLIWPVALAACVWSPLGAVVVAIALAAPVVSWPVASGGGIVGIVALAQWPPEAAAATGVAVALAGMTLVSRVKSKMVWWQALGASWYWPRLGVSDGSAFVPMPYISLPGFAKYTSLGRKVHAARTWEKGIHPVPDRAVLAKRWGAWGERSVAMMILSLPRGQWWAIHDVLVPDNSRANVDHVLVGRNGVWVIDAKQYEGQIEVVQERIMRNGATADASISTTAWEAQKVAEALGVPVKCAMVVPAGALKSPILCKVEGSSVDVVIAGRDQFADLVSRSLDETWSMTRRIIIAVKLVTRFRPASNIGMTPHLSVSRGCDRPYPVAGSPVICHVSAATRR